MSKDLVELGLKLGEDAGRDTEPDTSSEVTRESLPTAGAVEAVQPEPLSAIESADAARAVRHGQVLTEFVNRLLGALERTTPAADSGETRVFQTKLEEYRQVVLDPARRMEVPRITEACVAACEHYLKLSRQYHVDREKELGEVIGILRDAAKLSLGDSAGFTEELLATSERFHGLVHLQDVRQIRDRILEEVTSLRKSVEEKQRRDERAYTQLVSRVESLQAKLSEVEEEVTLDPLTRIGNRRRFETTLSRWLQTARETGMPVSLAMVDVDNFKHINDTHGHPIGDRVLAATAQGLTQGLRQTDFVARYGGEEFVILLPNASVAQVEGRLQELVKTIAAFSYDYDILGKKQCIRFTVSCGLTEWLAGESDADLVRRADEALYEAKRRGKNRVVTKKPQALSNLLSWG